MLCCGRHLDIIMLISHELSVSLCLINTETQFNLKNASTGSVKTAGSTIYVCNILRWCAMLWVILCIDNHLRLYINKMSSDSVTYTVTCIWSSINTLRAVGGNLTRQGQRSQQLIVAILHSLHVTRESRLNHHHDNTNHTIGHIVDDLVSHKTDF